LSDAIEISDRLFPFLVIAVTFAALKIKRRVGGALLDFFCERNDAVMEIAVRPRQQWPPERCGNQTTRFTLNIATFMNPGAGPYNSTPAHTTRDGSAYRGSMKCPLSNSTKLSAYTTQCGTGGSVNGRGSLSTSQSSEFLLQFRIFKLSVRESRSSSEKGIVLFLLATVVKGPWPGQSSVSGGSEKIWSRTFCLSPSHEINPVAIEPAKIVSPMIATCGASSGQLPTM
jgi:hypothetical protein